MNIRQTYHARPSALRYMLHAFAPRPGWRSSAGFPDLHLSWRGVRMNTEVLCAAAGLPSKESARLDVLAPHAIGFRLLMAVLTHRSWPLPIWGALQVRNRLCLHRHFSPNEALDLTVEVSGWRLLEKGIEVDLQASLADEAGCAWESIVTFYYRGGYGPQAEAGGCLGAPVTSPVLPVAPDATVEWRAQDRNRWRFGRLTGDYNGLHQWNWYARRFGFAAAFAHPQRMAAQGLVHLAQPCAAPCRLDLWIKGPIAYGSQVTQRIACDSASGEQDFSLSVTGDPRPAIVGRLTTETHN